MPDPTRPKPDARSRQQLMEEAMPVAQALHELMRDLDLDLMTFIAACHIADKIAVMYWREGTSNDSTTLDADADADAQRVRDAVAELKFGVLSKRPADPDSPGCVTSVTMLDQPINTPFKPGSSN